MDGQPGTIALLDAAVSAIEHAETDLDELSAIHRLEVLVRQTRRAAVIAALRHHSAATVGKHLGGVSRQTINKQYQPK